MSLLARWGTIIVVGLALLLGGARVARAEPGEDRGALPQAAPLQAPIRLVLIVANNRGVDLGRAELRYADDDGAKYRALFRVASAPADVQLLTRFDRDTARLFPDAPDGVPTRRAVEEKAVAFAARAAAAKRAGHEVELVFVYAGHGDVDRGKGFVQLEDGALTADDLANLVRRIDATRAHVILDSCNSLFLVSPRKPGGRHVATSDDAVRALRDRLPNVGVFLSTSADGEVFEWSELGAGIFSHAVRSGLAGAADANGDGRVTYVELRAFVEVATREVKNPRYRPTVFARGPAGDDQSALFVPRATSTRKLVIDGPMRTTLRDANDIPWIDAHVEEGARVELVLPPALDDGRASQVVLDVTGASPSVVRREPIAVIDAEPPSLVGPEPQSLASRGPSEIFRMLFVSPFGPRAMAAALPPDDAGPATYGLSRDDVTRFSVLLRQVADAERSRRHLAGLALLGGGIVAGTAGAVMIARDAEGISGGVAMGYLGSGIGLIVASPFVAFRPGPGEQLAERFEASMTRGASPSAAVAEHESRLSELARQERVYRLLGASLLGVAIAAEGTLFALNELRAAPDLELRGMLVSTMLFTTVSGLTMLAQTPIERLAHVWSSEPSRTTARVSVSPVGPGGPGLSLVGRF